jgi:hypothetical protein
MLLYDFLLLQPVAKATTSQFARFFIEFSCESASAFQGRTRWL